MRGGLSCQEMIRNDLLKRRRDARLIFDAGIRGVDPAQGIKAHCSLMGDLFYVNGKEYDLTRIRNVYIAGAGKASTPMAKALEEILGDRVKGGIINTKYGHVEDLKRVKVHQAGHPIPDRNGMEGARKLMDLVKRAEEDDLVIFVISGGGSALLPLPVEEISLEEKQKTTEILLSCGANIHEINTVRKHISQIKGGRLALASYPARVISFILSDVIGDDIQSIASGPTSADPTRFEDCLEIFERYKIMERIPRNVLEYIIKGAEGKAPETPKPKDPMFEKTQNLIIGNNFHCLINAKKKAIDLGYNSIILSTYLNGEARDSAIFHAAIAKEVMVSGNPVERPACLISGGETRVTIHGNGKGGRNQEFVLAFAMEIEGIEGIVVLSGGTDGTDGPTDAAGAIADGLTIKRARELGMDPSSFLKNNDSYHFFKNIGDLLVTGPTNTNVMDLRIVLVY
jgi:hydroxypyruvate reductase